MNQAPLSTLALELSDPFRIVVENRLDSMSPYILLEQETWFEADAGFVRAFLKPGMHVVDIGTNCGFYTLLAAEKVGSDGHVWGFEPGLVPARLLKESIAVNGFSNITLYEAAAGPEAGSAWFTDNNFSELSAIAPSGTPGTREVKVDSLDRLHAAKEIDAVDFIKIDAEGFEEQVILGGKNFFALENPVVMMEVMSETTDMRAADMLKAQGYQQYRYVPEVGCLVPLLIGKLGDFLLNVFLCKPEKAEELRTAGLLLTDDDLDKPYPAADASLFIDYFKNLPVFASCPSLAAMIPAMDQDGIGYGVMCAEYLMSRDSTFPVAERYVRLARAEKWGDLNFRNDLPHSVILSFVRVLAACGRFQLVVGLLGMVSNAATNISPVIQYPFLPLSIRWESLPAHDGNFLRWLLLMIIDEAEMLRSASSFYEPSGTRSAYDQLLGTEYLSEALERRAALLELIRGSSEFQRPAFIAGPVARNRDIWNEIAARLARSERRISSLDAGRSLA